MSTPNLQIPDISQAQRQKETTNNQENTLLEAAITEMLEVAVTTANVALSDVQHNQNIYFKFTGAMTGARDVTFKGRRRFALVEHACTGGYAITLKAGSGAGTSVAINNGDKKLVYIDGSSNAVYGPFS